MKKCETVGCGRDAVCVNDTYDYLCEKHKEQDIQETIECLYEKLDWKAYPKNGYCE